jgi:hypothetical protein
MGSITATNPGPLSPGYIEVFHVASGTENIPNGVGGVLNVSVPIAIPAGRVRTGDRVRVEVAIATTLLSTEGAFTTYTLSPGSGGVTPNKTLLESGGDYRLTAIYISNGTATVTVDYFAITNATPVIANVSQASCNLEAGVTLTLTLAFTNVAGTDRTATYRVTAYIEHCP